jgi:hypothetical protein
MLDHTAYRCALVTKSPRHILLQAVHGNVDSVTDILVDAICGAANTDMPLPLGRIVGNVK